jgi:hypothetical protein
MLCSGMGGKFLEPGSLSGTDVILGRAAHAVTDRCGRIIAMLTARPEDPGWEDDIKEIATAMAAAGKDVQWILDDLNHRRGWFKSLSTGVSYGGGQTVCRAWFSAFTPC